MRLIVKRILLSVFFCIWSMNSSLLYGNVDKNIQEVKNLVSPYLARNDTNSLNSLMSYFLKNNKNVHGLILYNNSSSKSIFKIYRLDGKIVVNEQFPTYIKLSRQKKIILSHGSKNIGTAILYHNFKKSEKEKQQAFLKQLNLTQEEKKWLSSHTVLRVSNQQDAAPYDFAKEGKAKGSSVDLVKLLALKLGLKLEFINGFHWNELLEQFSNEKIDLMHVFSKTKEREKKYLYSKPYMEIKYIYLTRKDDDRITSPKDFVNKKIGSVKGWSSTKILKERYVQSKILEYKSISDMLRALSIGEVDLVVNDTSSAAYYIAQERISNVQLKGYLNLTTKSADTGFYYATHPNNKAFISILNKSLQILELDDLLEINRKWFGAEGVSHEDAYRISLTQEEEQWIKRNPIVKIAVMDYWESDDNGKTLHTEVLKLISEHIGINLSPVYFDDWNKGYEEAMRGDNVYGIMGLSWSEDREKKHFFYTPAYTFTPSYLIIKQDNKWVKSIEDLRGKSIYLKTNSITHRLVKEQLDTINIIDVDKMEDLYMKLANSTKADAFLSYDVQDKDLEDNNLKVAQVLYDKYGEVSLGINQKFIYLNSIIQRAFNHISKEELSELRDKQYKKSIYKGMLSSEEKKYLSQKKSLKVCVQNNTEPMQFQGEKVLEGIIVDIIKVLEQNLNIKIDLVKTQNHTESETFLEQGKCDFTSLRLHEKEKESFFYTNPYLKYDLAIIATSDKPLATRLSSLSQEVMSAKKGSDWIPKLKQQYPFLKIKEVSNTLESLRELERGNAYYTIASVPTYSYFKSKYGLNDLQVIGYVKNKYNFAMAVSKNENILLEILNKELNKIPQSTIDIIHDKWAAIKVIEKINWSLLLKISVVVAIILVLMLVYNRKLNSMVKHKTADIEEQKEELKLLISQFDKNVIFSKTDLKGKITHVSKAFCKTSGYSQEELLGKNHNFIRHPHMPASVFETIWEELKNERVVTKEIQNIRKDGSSYWLESRFEPDYNQEGELIGYLALRVDITDKIEVQELSESLEKKVEERTKELAESNAYMKDSIGYASLIQSSLIPNENVFNKYFHDSFVFWKPKDKVGGDIYLLEELGNDDECIIMVIDCTGHGVSGAFVTMLVKAIERQIIAEMVSSKELILPAKILQQFNKSIKSLLNQESSEGLANVGFDGQVLYYNRKEKKVCFSSARNEIFYVQNNVLNVKKGDRHSIGYKDSDVNYQFSDYWVDVSVPTTFYISSDGYWDQLGGVKNRSFGKKRLKTLLEEINHRPMNEQKEELVQSLKEYQGENERLDDVTFVGLKINESEATWKYQI